MKPRPFFYGACLALVAAAVTLAACSDDTNTPGTTADLKLLHAAAATGRTVPAW